MSDSRSEGRMPGRTPGFVAWFAVAVGVLVLRAPDVLSNPQFWAEDGVIFFLQQRSMGLGSLAEPYMGYLHTVPRLVALLAAAFPAWLAPLAYNAAAIGGGALSLAWLCSRLRDPGAGVVLMLAALLSLTNGEVFGTLTNLQWFLQLFLAGACLVPPETGRTGHPVHRITLLALVLLASLTGPFAVFVLAVLGLAVALCLLPDGWLPTAALRAWLRRLDRGRLACLAAGSGVQLAVFATHGTPEPAAMTMAEVAREFADVLQAHTFGAVLLPATVSLALLLAMALGLLRQARRPALAADRFLVLALLALGTLQVAAGMAKMTIPLEIAISDRYVFVFKLAFWTALAMLLQGALRSRHHALLLVLATLGFLAASHPGHLQRAPFEDKQWRSHAPALDRGEAVEIPINPTPWVIQAEARPDAP